MLRTGHLVPIRALAFAIAAVFAMGLYVLAFVDLSPRYPDEWDPRVADLAAFVEQTRGQPFKHPVFVDFLEEESFEGTVSNPDPSDDQREAALQDVAVFRALGLLSGAVDLLAENDQVATQGIAAFYSPTSERITIRGTELSPLLRSTIVHELTHTWQDQYHDLERLGQTDTAAESAALRALAEGDATRIEKKFVASLEPGAAGDLTDEQATRVDSIDLDETPDVLVALFGAPYTLGGPFIDTLEAIGGNARIDEAFENPPTSEEHLLDPFSYLAGDGVAEEVALQPLPDGVEAFEEGDFGAVLLYMMLAERIDPAEALQAVLGWNGDAYAAYEIDDQVCVSAGFATDSESDRDELREALVKWSTALPNAEVMFEEIEGDYTFVSCDPGPEVDLMVVGRSSDSLDLPFVRSLVASVNIASHGEAVAECIGQRVITVFTFEEISSDNTTIYTDGQFQMKIDEALADCS